jgi:acetylornithine deacetylase/succinyl-diaminopimelate desuccinylase-like protein
MAFTPAVSSTDSDLYRAIEAVVERHYPASRVIPSVSTGFTDSHFFRDLGIIAYGFDPTVVPLELQGTVHGNNERVPVESIEKGVGHLLEILQLLVH